MTKIDIFSGFLGAGKTTLIKKLLAQTFTGEKIVLIENEFGQIGIDGGFLKESGVQVTEMNSGCICCSLVGDFGKALAQVLQDYNPDRILIEPSGVGKLSDVIRAVRGVESAQAALHTATTVVDAGKCRLYMKNFGEFFNDQVKSAGCIVLSHTEGLAPDKLSDVVAMLREHNASATIITTPWDQLDGAQMVASMEHRHTLATALEQLEHEHHHHHHDHECDDPECSCHEHEHHHHHHHDHECDDPECSCHEHEHHHHHDHDHECDDPECACHEHGQHHHHHADDVFTSWGTETTNVFSTHGLTQMLKALDEPRFGTVLRAKGIVQGENGTWLHFDFVPGTCDVRVGAADVIGRLCVIGAELDQTAIAHLFGVDGQ